MEVRVAGFTKTQALLFFSGSWLPPKSSLSNYQLRSSRALIRQDSATPSSLLLLSLYFVAKLIFYGTSFSYVVLLGFLKPVGSFVPVSELISQWFDHRCRADTSGRMM
ncbi:hypothetical protein F5H01DRAFT_325035 [Linnemannia elongata]|nr:hypothetical protein F5H01DRAFT_325035 [Linnemannia elongata]